MSRFHKKIALTLLGVFVVSLGLYVAPRLYAALFTYIYPDKDILVDRSFEPDDLSGVGNGDAITVTLDVTNNEDVALRGFYYSDQVPNGWGVNTVGVAVNGVPIADYTYEQGLADGIYNQFTPQRWALELPQGGGVFSPTHPIAASDGTAQIVYTMIVAGGTGSDYTIGREAWAGWLESEPTGTAVFGYHSVTGTLTADFTADPRSGAAPLTVTFTDLSTDAPTEWTWNFGDNSPVSSQQHPTHVYADPGVYDVTLTVTRSEPLDSDTVIKSGFITVTAPPLQANFSATPRLGVPPLSVKFTDLSVGDVLTYAWDFGDEDTTSLPNPTHVYSDLGYYTVTLTVQDAYGSDTLVRPRYVHTVDVIYNVYLAVMLKGE